MAVPQKNTLVNAQVQDSNGNTYSALVSSNGPNQGQILQLYQVQPPNNLIPVDYQTATNLYQNNQNNWNNQINGFLQANNQASVGVAPSFQGIANQSLFDKNYQEKVNAANATGAAGTNAPFQNLASKNIQPPPSTYGKVYVFPEDLNVGKFGSASNKESTPQDYIRIGALKYQVPQPGLITQGGLDKSIIAPSAIIGNGLASFNASLPKNLSFLGEVVLPMPASITDGAKTEWGISKMSVMGAALATSLSGLYGAGVLGTASELGAALGADGGIQAFAALGKYMAEAKLASNPAASQAFSADVISQVIGKVSSTPVEPGDLLTRSTGAAVNPNAELLFRSPSLRTFDMQWKLTPRSKKEASLVRKIIRFFKINMLPTAPQSGSVLLQSPNVFVLRYEKADGNYNPSLPKPKLCALGQITVNHTPDGVGWAAYQDSHPVSTIIQMSFLELTPLLANDFATTAEDDVGL